MLAFFAFGAFGFFLLLVLLVILLFFCVESDSPGVGTLAVLGFAALTCWSSSFNPFAWLTANWLVVVITFAVYCFCGVMWSIKKWSDYVSSRITHLKEAATRARNNRDTLRENISYGYREIPKVSQNKSKLACWICYWPFSAIWWFVDDWFHFLVRSLQGVYRSITMRAYAGLDAELKAAVNFEEFEQDKEE